MKKISGLLIQQLITCVLIWFTGLMKNLTSSNCIYLSIGLELRFLTHFLLKMHSVIFLNFTGCLFFGYGLLFICFGVNCMNTCMLTIHTKLTFSSLNIMAMLFLIFKPIPPIYFFFALQKLHNTFTHIPQILLQKQSSSLTCR